MYRLTKDHVYLMAAGNTGNLRRVVKVNVVKRYLEMAQSKYANWFLWNSASSYLTIGLFFYKRNISTVSSVNVEVVYKIAF